MVYTVYIVYTNIYYYCCDAKSACCSSTTYCILPILYVYMNVSWVLQWIRFYFWISWYTDYLYNKKYTEVHTTLGPVRIMEFMYSSRYIKRKKSGGPGFFLFPTTSLCYFRPFGDCPLFKHCSIACEGMKGALVKILGWSPIRVHRHQRLARIFYSSCVCVMTRFKSSRATTGDSRGRFPVFRTVTAVEERSYNILCIVYWVYIYISIQNPCV